MIAENKRGCWKKRTLLEKWLVFVVIFSFLLWAWFIFLFFKKGHNEVLEIVEENESTTLPVYEDEVCTTEGCLKAASKLLSSMDPDALPCDDFYQFACSLKTKKYMPTGQTVLNRSTDLKDRLRGFMIKILEDPEEHEKFGPFAQALSVYNLCSYNNGYSTLFDIFESVGGWPVMEENWPRTAWTWTDATYRLSEWGFDVDFLIRLDVSEDPAYPDVMIPKLDQPSLGVGLEYLMEGEDNPVVRRYYEYMVKVVVLIKGNDLLTEDELLQTLRFEIELAKLSKARRERMDFKKLYNVMTIRDMSVKFPTIPWREYLMSLVWPDGKSLTEDQRVLVFAPKYLAGLETLLDRTPKRTLANYILWRTVDCSVPFMSEKFAESRALVTNAMTGVETFSWETFCCDFVTENLAVAVAYVYLETIDKNLTYIPLDIADFIKSSLYEAFTLLEWMDYGTRYVTRTKLDSIVIRAGFLDELFNKTLIAEYYKELAIDNDKPFFNAWLAIVKFKLAKRRDYLKFPSEESLWVRMSERSLGVEPVYDVDSTFLYLPAAVIRNSDMEEPTIIKFARFGFMIGRNLMHAFDEGGRLFRQKGRWHGDKELITAKCKYMKMAQCFIQKYGNYTEIHTGMKVDGVSTLGENIADVAGLKYAYKAYLDWMEQTGPKARLLGLEEYTTSQIFWISVANSICSTYRNETLRHMMTTSAELSAHTRVVGSFSNLEGFAKDFNCPLGTLMNPLKRCTLW